MDTGRDRGSGHHARSCSHRPAGASVDPSRPSRGRGAASRARIRRRVACSGRTPVRTRHLVAAVSVAVGGLRAANAADGTQFVIVGPDQGPAVHREPVSGQPGDVGETHGKPAHAYTMAAFPTAAQLSRYGTKGPWSSSTRAGQLSNVGYAEATYAVAKLEAGRLRAARGLDRRRTAARPALADGHRLAATREPVRPRGTDARPARREVLLRRLLLPVRVAVDHRLLVAARGARLGHRGPSGLPERGTGPVPPAQLLRRAASRWRSGTTTPGTTT